MMFTTLMGDADQAEDHVAGLFDFAAKTPFETGPIIEASKHLQIFGGDALNTMDNLTLVGDAAAAVGQPIDEVGFWIGRLYSNLQGGQPFGEAAMRLQELGIMTPQARAELEAMQETGASGSELWATYTGELGAFTGAMELQSQSWVGLTSTIKDQLGMLMAEALAPFFELAKTGLESLAAWLASPEVQAGIQNIATGFTTLITKVTEFVTNSVIPFVQQHGEALKNILAAIGLIILASVIPAIVSLAISLAPIVLVVAAVAAVIALLRTAWEQNWGGIQEKVAAAWAFIQPLLQQVKDWLAVHVPIALEALRAFWVDVAWPAIQRVIEVVWPVIQKIFQAIGTFITETLIPTLQTLYTKWTEDVWPTIQTVTENVWTIIEEIFTEIGRWINDNIVPWIEFLHDKWVDEVWPAIQTALEKAWEIIEPIWEAIRKWAEETLPPVIEGLQTVFETVMGAISAAIEPVKTVWDGLVNAVQGFWTWLTGKSFNFDISIPDLPDWATPGSPLPIHIAWRNFADDMGDIGRRIADGFLAAFAGAEDFADRVFDITGKIAGLASGFENIFAARNVAPLEGLLGDIGGRIDQFTDSLQGMTDSLGLNLNDPALLLQLQQIMNNPAAGQAERDIAATALGFLQERQDLLLEQIQLQRQLEEQQSRMLRLEMQRQQLGFLQQQFDLIKLINENGLSPDLLAGLEFGIDADPAALMDVMVAAMNQLIGNAAGALGVAAGGVTGRSSLPEKFFAGAAAVAGGGNTVTVNIDARGAGQGVERDLRGMIEDVMREYGVRADIRMRTT